MISACAADDVLAISGFGIFLGISFNADADTTSLLLHGPIEVIHNSFKLLYSSIDFDILIKTFPP